MMRFEEELKTVEQNRKEGEMMYKQMTGFLSACTNKEEALYLLLWRLSDRLEGVERTLRESVVEDAIIDVNGTLTTLTDEVKQIGLNVLDVEESVKDLDRTIYAKV